MSYLKGWPRDWRSTTSVGKHYHQAWSWPSPSATLPLATPTLPWSSPGVCLKTQYPLSSVRCAKPYKMSTLMRCWDAQLLQMNGARLLIYTTSVGISPTHWGSVDGKHVRIICPNNSGSVYYNYKHFYSILLFVLVDADYKFLWADVSGNGANDSELKRRVEDGTIGWPDPAPIPGDNQPMPYFIVGDDAFALRKTMMKPYSRRNLGHDERIFNYRLSRARRVVENAFGILIWTETLIYTLASHPFPTVAGRYAFGIGKVLVRFW